MYKADGGVIELYNQSLRTMHLGCVKLSNYFKQNFSSSSDDDSTVHLNEKNEKIKCPAQITGNNFIYISEPFLRYIWCYSYHIMSCWHGENLRLNNKYEIDRIEYFLNESHSVLNYGDSLWTAYSDWPDYLPSPIKSSSILGLDDNFKIIKLVNGYFAVQLLAILLHELGHKVYGHNRYAPDNDNQEREEENHADEQAVSVFLECIDNRDERSIYKIPYLLTYGAFLHQVPLPIPSTHPAEHLRFDHVLAKLMENTVDKKHATEESFYNDSDGLLYIISIFVFMKWLETRHSKNVSSNISGKDILNYTQKEWYQAVFEEVKKLVDSKLSNQ